MKKWVLGQWNDAFKEKRIKKHIIALDRFDVSLAPGDPARLMSVDGSAEQASGWFMKSLTPGGRLCGCTGGEMKRLLSFLLEVSGKSVVFSKI